MTATSTSRSAHHARWLAVPAALVLSAVLVWQASYAAFSDASVNEDNTWATGTVELTTEDGGQALFSVENLAPGSAGASRDVVASYTGSLDARASLYARDFREPAADADGKTLADYIDLTIEVTDGPTFSETRHHELYSGTLAGFAEKHNGFGAGGLVHDIDVDNQSTVTTGTLRFTYAIDANAPNSVQGQQVGIDFVAEAQSR